MRLYTLEDKQSEAQVKSEKEITESSSNSNDSVIASIPTLFEAVGNDFNEVKHLNIRIRSCLKQQSMALDKR